MLYTWKSMQGTDFGAQTWLVDDWIPAGGVVLIWGKESVGKTPVCWHLARSVGAGEPFFGWQTRQARALFIELDMPDYFTKERTKDLPFPDSVGFELVGHPIEDFREEALREVLAGGIEFAPEVVFIDSLRKFHPLDDKASETPSKVYGMYARLFPGAALVFIHHERKGGGDDDTRPDEESYSGSRAWSNNCQVGFRVSEDTRQRFPVLVKNTRHQFMEKGWSQRFHLDHGWLLTADNDLKVVEALMESTGQTGGDVLVKAIMEKLGCSRMTAYRKIKAVTR